MLVILVYYLNRDFITSNRENLEFVYSIDSQFMVSDHIVVRGTVPGGPRAQSVVDKIFSVIRELAGGNKTVKLSEIREQCTSKGYQPDHVEDCIEQYEELNVWQVNQARTTITFV